MNKSGGIIAGSIVFIFMLCAVGACVTFYKSEKNTTTHNPYYGVATSFEWTPFGEVHKIKKEKDMQESLLQLMHYSDSMLTISMVNQVSFNINK